jgi:hypothetical protein
MAPGDDLGSSTSISQESPASLSIQNADKGTADHPGPEDSASAGYVDYRVEYRSADKDELIHQYRSDDKVTRVHPSKAGVAYEVISIYKTTKDKDEASALEGAPPSITSIPQKLIRIHSPALIHALHTVVTYYPSQDLTGERIEIHEPYAILVHHEQELADFKERCKPDGRPLCIKEKNAYHHLGLLQQYLEETVMQGVREEQERNARGFYTFDWFWVYAKPGNTIQGWVKNDEGNFRGRVISSLEGGTFTRPSKKWTIMEWTMRYDGRFLGRSPETTETSKFDGERSTSSFKVFDFKKSKENELTKLMVQRGRKFISLLNQRCQYYQGDSVDFPQIHVCLATS